MTNAPDDPTPGAPRTEYIEDDPFAFQGSDAEYDPGADAVSELLDDHHDGEIDDELGIGAIEQGFGRTNDKQHPALASIKSATRGKERPLTVNGFANAGPLPGIKHGTQRPIEIATQAGSSDQGAEPEPYDPFLNDNESPFNPYGSVRNPRLRRAAADALAHLRNITPANHEAQHDLETYRLARRQLTIAARIERRATNVAHIADPETLREARQNAAMLGQAVNGFSPATRGKLGSRFNHETTPRLRQFATAIADLDEHATTTDITRLYHDYGNDFDQFAQTLRDPDLVNHLHNRANRERSKEIVKHLPEKIAGIHRENRSAAFEAAMGTTAYGSDTDAATAALGQIVRMLSLPMHVAGQGARALIGATVPPLLRVTRHSLAIAINKSIHGLVELSDEMSERLTAANADPTPTGGEPPLDNNTDPRPKPDEQVSYESAADLASSFTREVRHMPTALRQRIGRPATTPWWVFEGYADPTSPRGIKTSNLKPIPTSMHLAQQIHTNVASKGLSNLLDRIWSDPAAAPLKADGDHAWRALPLHQQIAGATKLVERYRHIELAHQQLSRTGRKAYEILYTRRNHENPSEATAPQNEHAAENHLLRQLSRFHSLRTNGKNESVAEIATKIEGIWTQLPKAFRQDVSGLTPPGTEAVRAGATAATEPSARPPRPIRDFVPNTNIAEEARWLSGASEMFTRSVHRIATQEKGLIERSEKRFAQRDTPIEQTLERLEKAAERAQQPQRSDTQRSGLGR